MDIFDINLLRPKVTDDLRRVGNRNFDGGYIIPDSVIKNTKILLSFGISTNWSFEKEFLRESALIRIVTLDGSVKMFSFAKSAFKAIIKCLIKVVTSDYPRAKFYFKTFLGYNNIQYQFFKFILNILCILKIKNQLLH